MEEFEETPAETPPKPSKTPSWIMLGFLLGAISMWMLPTPKPRRAAPPPVAIPMAPAPAPRLTDLEAAFEIYGPRYAIWANGSTYVCLWDSAETQTFRDCFQVLQQGDQLFFRSVPRPRDLRARNDVPKECPLEFLNPIPEARGLFGLPATKPPEPPSK